MTDLIVTDTTLRDGSHAVSHSFSPEFVREVTMGLAKANVPIIEVGHGAGLQGSTIQQGFSKYEEWELIQAAVESKGDSQIASLFVPGIGTRPQIVEAAAIGIDVIRIAVHCTEADISQQYFKQAKESGLVAVGFLMMSHAASPEKLALEAKKMESYGADSVYIVDSAGALVPLTVRERIQALQKDLTIPVGFHAHNNLGLAIGNTLAAMEEGASMVDGTLRGLGAGAGNAPIEVLIAVLNKMGIDSNIHLSPLMDLAEDVIVPIMPYPIVINRDNLASGYAGVYNSFLLHVREAAQKFNVQPIAIIEELGKRQAVAGQEDWIIDVAMELASAK
ncbi:4-hydroxy-2-oxovalerate aldolase [Bacillus sp. OxB-1]|uniref:4-hydroxy-2-oxovalerate aldolase n=1 Tax=Bacillus sp. (strain OxB-1) TaxID=98228 RepID=UPI000581ECAB|nr:4-hydroxy-2-oxovalerate aldolase [Bacillus sp. OxB-1]BAQ10974.1 4-hydroxy-2-oxovalerate aldolase [Bacillus sp. OxB-1]